MKTAAVLPLIAVLAVNGANLRRSAPTEQQAPADDNLIIRLPTTGPFGPLGPGPFNPNPGPFNPNPGPFNPTGPFDPIDPFNPIPTLQLYEKHHLPPYVETLLPEDDFDGSMPAADPIPVEEEQQIPDDQLLIIKDPSRPLIPPIHLPFPPIIPHKPILKLYQKKLPPYIDTFFPVDDIDGPMPVVDLIPVGNANELVDPIPEKITHTAPVEEQASDDNLIVRRPIIDPFDPFNIDPYNPIPHRPHGPFIPLKKPTLQLFEKHHLPPYVDTFLPEDYFDGPMPAVDPVPVEEETTETSVENDEKPRKIVCHMPPRKDVEEVSEMVIDPAPIEEQELIFDPIDPFYYIEDPLHVPGFPGVQFDPPFDGIDGPLIA